MEAFKRKPEHFTFIKTPAGAQRIGVCVAAEMLELFWQRRIELDAEEVDRFYELLIDLMEDTRNEQWRFEIPDSDER